MSDLNPDAIKMHGGRRPGAGRKPSRLLATVASENTPIENPDAQKSGDPCGFSADAVDFDLPHAWQRASDAERCAFVRDHRAWFAHYGG